jgi:hypothetical protein
MSQANDPKYESPSKKELEETLAKYGKLLPPEIRGQLEQAIATLDHTDPKQIVQLLPQSVLAFYQHTLARTGALAPLIVKAHYAGCYIESIILSHGLIQFALRSLYVLAWQRMVLPTPLTEGQLAPYYKQGLKKGDVFQLIAVLEENGLIFDFHANHLRDVNQIRNKAAHGIIFGEIDPPALEQSSDKARHASLGALERVRTWFNNPRPLQKLPSSSAKAP